MAVSRDVTSLLLMDFLFNELLLPIIFVILLKTKLCFTCSVIFWSKLIHLINFWWSPLKNVVISYVLGARGEGWYELVGGDRCHWRGCLAGAYNFSQTHIWWKKVKTFRKRLTWRKLLAKWTLRTTVKWDMSKLGEVCSRLVASQAALNSSVLLYKTSRESAVKVWTSYQAS